MGRQPRLCFVPFAGCLQQALLVALQVGFSLGLSHELGSPEQSGTQTLAQADASQGFSTQGTVGFPSAPVPMPLSFKLSPDHMTVLSSVFTLSCYSSF